MATSGDFAAALAPGLKKWFVLGGKERSQEYMSIMDRVSSKRAYEEFRTMAGLGVAVQKPEGQSFTFDDGTQGDLKRLTAVSYGLGFEVTHEMWSDDLYGQMRQLSKELGRSHRELVERICANVYNNGFTGGTELAADGLTVFNALHTQPGTATTFSNTAATDISITSLQAATNYFETENNPRGLRMLMRLGTILAPPESRFTIREMLNSPQKPFTSDNEINSMQAENIKVLYSHYLADNDSWFAMSDDKEAHWPKLIIREALSFDHGMNKDTKSARFYAFQRLSAGVVDPHGLYGNAGV